MISYILALICGIVILLADQFTKYFIVSNFELSESCDFINGLIDIIYVNNKGGAWGILDGYTWALLSITVIVMIICFTLLVKLGKENKILFWAITFVLFGGIGNMIDRVLRDGNVVDFLHFEFWPSFPVFNIADCAIVIGGGLLVLYFILDCIKDVKKRKKNFTK